MKRIRLTGKYAIGLHRYAYVDDADFIHLSAWSWKAKPTQTGSQVYAVRNIIDDNGVNRTVRMHREILEYDGEHDVDHINQNPLDNQRHNLRIVSRSVNVNNTKTHTVNGVCKVCGIIFNKEVKVGVNCVIYCSDLCKGRWSNRNKKRASVIERHCEICDEPFHDTENGHGRFCSESCKKKAKRARQKLTNSLPPSAVKAR